MLERRAERVDIDRGEAGFTLDLTSALNLTLTLSTSSVSSGAFR